MSPLFKERNLKQRGERIFPRRKRENLGVEPKRLKFGKCVSEWLSLENTGHRPVPGEIFDLSTFKKK